MIVAVPKESAEGERRVALVPEAASKLAEAGFEVRVEAGAGEAAGFPDALYKEAGVKVVAPAKLYDGAGAVLRVQSPSKAEISKLPKGSLLIGFLAPLTDAKTATALAERGVTAYAMESIPRITRAQAMDALSSQANVGGYKAVLLAADTLPKFFPMLTTAAGTVRPARVLVLGAGVAGLQAIATARRLGAIVEAFDTRPVVKEQVESLGARFLAIELEEDAEGAGGYAKELSEEAHRMEQELLAGAVPEADVVITTAAIPGRPAPELITAAMVDDMRPGSVIVDLAAETGGNCALTKKGEDVVHEGVTIIGRLNLPSTLPLHASQLYARNVSALLTHLAPEGEPALDFEDEITREACITHDGRVVGGVAATEEAGA